MKAVDPILANMRIGEDKVLFETAEMAFGLRRCVAVEYLAELCSNPYRSVSPFELYNLFNRQAVQREMSGSELIQTGLAYYDTGFEARQEMIDRKGLKDINQRLNVLMQAEAEAREFRDLARVDDLIAEREAIVAYLLGVLDNRQKVKRFRNEGNRIEESVNRALRRLLIRMAEQAPDLAGALGKDLILRGMLCYAPEYSAVQVFF